MRASALIRKLVLGLAIPYVAAADPIFENGFEECGAITTRACYTGPAGTSGVGSCQAGTQRCENGAWSPCTSEVTPLFESCNLSDDDCDAATDELLGSTSCGVGACKQTVAACSSGVLATCTPGQPSVETCDGIDNDCDGAIDEDGCDCVHVTPTGLDTAPGTAVNPMRTIAAAITRAATLGPAEVCVAAGLTCTVAVNYDESVVMQNGVNVYGGYQASGATWPRSVACVTRIRAQDALGVQFGVGVTSPTILDGFAITGGNAATNAAVTISGSTGAVLSNDVITGGGGTNSYGVNVVDDAGTAATPALSGNAITGGAGTALAIGVRSLNSAPRIEGSCSALDASGRCTSSCPSAGTLRFIRGRGAGGTGSESYGVRLENSPGTSIASSSICSNAASTTDAAGVRISGDAEDVVIRGSNVSGTGGAQNSAGIRMDDCAGASPWIVDNASIASRPANAAAHADGVRAVGDCHPRIDENISIVGSNEGASGDANGVYCGVGAVSGVPSRCTLEGNVKIQASTSGFTPNAVGVRCDDGACASIRGNVQILGGSGQNVIGVALGASGTLVDANLIQAGCVTGSATGLAATNSYARIQNNRIEGATAGGICAATPATSVALSLSLGTGLNEVDLHSNDLVAELGAGTCTSRGLAIGLVGGAPAGGRGVIRNNIVLPGACSTNIAIDELAAGADPRVLQNNDLWSLNPPTALYRDEAANNLTTIGAVNALGDLTVSANISVDPAYDGSNKLQSFSLCIDAGTSAGAPARDFEGETRPQGPAFDIGRDEFAP